jgi:hypothetical protein
MMANNDKKNCLMILELYSYVTYFKKNVNSGDFPMEDI